MKEKKIKHTESKQSPKQNRKKIYATRKRSSSLSSGRLVRNELQYALGNVVDKDGVRADGQKERKKCVH